MLTEKNAQRGNIGNFELEKYYFSENIRQYFIFRKEISLKTDH